jgi:starvation-inducible outer membrane lipoprotein
MLKENLYDYVFSVIQEEECLLWDVTITEPERWINEYEEPSKQWGKNGTWLSRVIVKMLDTYKEDKP